MIIIALIDVLIVVLIFLLVTTTFKQQPALKLTLPESTQGTTEGSSELAPVYVSIDKAGLIYLGANSEPVTAEALRAQLVTLVVANPLVRIALAAHEESPLLATVQVWDAVRAAGVKTGLSIHTRVKEAK